MTKNLDADKYSCFGYGSEFDACESFSLFNDNNFGKNGEVFPTCREKYYQHAWVICAC